MKMVDALPRYDRVPYRMAKRLFDVAFSLLVLVGLCWLYGAIALAIKLDSPEAPVVFKQKRVGKDGAPFTIYKFRSMRVGAEEDLDGLRGLNEKNGPVFKIHDDPRITRVGRWLRRTSLDELPQFINVLRGDMSIVGPRPALPWEVEQYTARQRMRLGVRPGITCIWQTQPNRDAIPFDEWVELDIRYLETCSMWADLKLIAKTVAVVMTAQGS